MSDDEWRELLAAYVRGDISAADFHDRFLDRWRAWRDAVQSVPPAIDHLFYEVEAFSPDPSLRRGDEPTERELHDATRRALDALSRRQP